MAKSVQYLLAFFCMALLVSYQNCAPTFDPAVGSYNLGSDNPTENLGNYYLDVVGPIAVGPTDSAINIYGYCSPGKSQQNYIEWQLYTSSGYSGSTTGRSGNCYNQYYQVQIPLYSGFNYQAGSRVALKYVVVSSSGVEESRSYSIDLAEGVVGTTENTVDCGSHSLGSGSSLRECDLSAALTRTSLGFGGLAIKARVSVNSVISSRSDFYALFNLTDSAYVPYFTYGTGRNDNSSNYTFERFLYGTSKFTVQNNVWASSVGKLFIRDSKAEEVEHLWLNASSYDIELRFSVAPVAQGTSLMIVKICPANSTSNCITESSLSGSRGRSAAFIKKAFGLNGLKLVFGMPNSFSSSVSGEWINPSNWTINNVSVKLCGSDLLPPSYENDGYCQF